MLLGASINEERFLDRIDWNWLFYESTSSRFDVVNKYGFVFYRETTYCSRIFYFGKMQNLTQHRAGSTGEKSGERRRASSRSRLRQPLFFFLTAQARKLSPSASLEWEEQALQRHARDSDGDAVIKVSSFSSVVWVHRFWVVALHRSSS